MTAGFTPRPVLRRLFKPLLGALLALIGVLAPIESPELLATPRRPRRPLPSPGAGRIGRPRHTRQLPNRPSGVEAAANRSRVPDRIGLHSGITALPRDSVGQQPVSSALFSISRIL